MKQKGKYAEISFVDKSVGLRNQDRFNWYISFIQIDSFYPIETGTTHIPK